MGIALSQTKPRMSLTVARKSNNIDTTMY